MSETNPTAERREEILGELAEWMHAAAREAQRRLLEAETTDAFATLAGSLAKLARGVRQSILMQDRLEGRRLSAEAAAEDARTEAEAEARRNAVDRQRVRIDRAVGRRFEEEWPETEDLEDNDEFNARVEHLSARLDDLSERGDFLETDPDALIAKLCEEFGIAPAQPPLIPAKAGTQAETATAPSPHGSPPARGRAGDGVHAPNTS